MFFGAPSAVRRVALAQAALVLVLPAIGGLGAGAVVGVALFYGALTALALTLVLVWREGQSMRHPEWDRHRLLRVFIRTGVERGLLLVALLYGGLALLDLAPLPVLLGLVLAQFGWLAAMGRN
jgi:ATP synthase protein I